MAISLTISLIRDKLEKNFGYWATITYRHPWLIIGIFTILVASASTQLSHITVETSPDSFLNEDNPSRKAYDEFRREFGRDEMIMVVIDAQETVFDIDFLTTLTAFHHALEEELPKTQDVLSLVNARDTQGTDDELIVEDLLEELPSNREELQALKQRVMDNPLYINRFIDRHHKMAVMLIKTDAFSSLQSENTDDDSPTNAELLFFDANTNESATQMPFITGEENAEIINTLTDIIDRFQTESFDIHTIGTPVMINRLTRILLHDMTLFTSLALGIIAFLLTVIFRRVEVVFLPLIVAVLSVVFTLSVMESLGIGISIAVQIMPSLLLAIGVGNAIHIFTPFYQALDRGVDKQTALQFAMMHSGLAVVLTSLTTAGGLFSFATAEVKPIAEFGIIAPIGVIITQIFSLVLLPALIAIMPIKKMPPRGSQTGVGYRLMQICARVSARQPVKVIIIWSLLILISMAFSTQIQISHHQVNWFPKSDDFRLTSERMNEVLGGNVSIELVLDTGVENGVQSSKFLQQIDELYARTALLKFNELQVGKSVSIIDVSKELHKALNNNDDKFYVIPAQRATIAQELLLLENSGNNDVYELVDSQFSKARVSMSVPFLDAVKYPPFQAALLDIVASIFDEETTVTLTGITAIMSHMITALIKSMINSYLVAFMIICPLMVIMVGSLRMGLLSMIPNLCPIIMALGLMGLTDIPLDAFTLLIGSIALGLAVDDTIHFMHNYQRYYQWTGDSEKAIKKTLDTTGQALLFTTVVLSSSFLIYTFSTMENLFNFGLLTAFSITCAFLADIFLAPALVTLAHHNQPKHSPAVANSFIQYIAIHNEIIHIQEPEKMFKTLSGEVPPITRHTGPT